MVQYERRLLLLACALLFLAPVKGPGAEVVAWGAGMTNSGQYPDLGQSVIPPGLAGVLGIAGGDAFTMALTADGIVAAWGDNSLGQTGVPNDLTGVVAVTAGYYHALALKGDGTVVAWGDDGLMQTEVPLDLTNAVAIAAGQFHSLALKSDGTVTAWGDNSGGQTDIPEGLTNVVAIAAGAVHCLALLAGGTVVAWGDNTSGQTDVPGGLSQVQAIAAGSGHSLALKADGSIRSWGSGPRIPNSLSLPRAAIVSTAAGDASSTPYKSTAIGGDVVIVAVQGGTTIIDGGALANGSVNTLLPSLSPVQEHLYGTSNEIPDYTNPASTNQIFDFNRFLAAADASHNHFTNSASFVSAMNALKGAALEGIVAVDLPASVPVNLAPSNLPYGINVRGTLLINFKNDSRRSWSPFDKVILTAALNVNPAALALLNPADPSTFPTGYPPVYLNPGKNPANVDISTQGYQNFFANEELPALMYNNALLDIHGPVNVSGAIYSPSFIEIENKTGGATQYIRGPLIGGAGIYLENTTNRTFIVSVERKPIAISACASQNLALRADGKLTGWGSDPGSAPPEMSNVVAIAAGVAHALALVDSAPPVLQVPLANARFDSNGFSTSLATRSGRVYMLEYKESLADPDWRSARLAAGNGANLTLTDSTANSPQRFYRVRQW